MLQSGPCIDINKIVKGLDKGRYSFNRPKQAYLEESFSLALVLETSKDQDILSSFQGMPGEVIEKTAPMAQYLEASLTGSDLKIEPSGSQHRTVTSVAPVEWQWSVTPLKGGKKTLTLEVAANIMVGSERSRVQLKTLREEIEIRVTTFQWAKGAVSEASGAVVALSGFIAALLGLFTAITPIRRRVLDYWNSWLTKPAALPPGNASN